MTDQLDRTDVDGALAPLLGEVPVRALVPTARQLAVGDDAAGAVAATAPYELVVTPARRGARGGVAAVARALVANFDLRGLGAPALPLAVICLVAVFQRIEESALGVLLPQIRAEFGVSVAFLATLSTLIGIANMLLLVPFGYLADRTQRVWMMRGGSLATSATIGLQGLAGSLPVLAALRVANGLSVSIAPPASFTLTTDYYAPAARARVFAAQFSASQVGLVAGPVVAGVLGDRFGWRVAVLALGGAALTVALLTFLLREPPRGAAERAALGAAEPPVQQEPMGFAEAYRAARSIVTLRRMWYATVFVSVRGIFALLIMPLYFAETFQLGTAQLGLLFTVNGITGLVGLLFAGRIGERLLADRPGRYLYAMGGATAGQALLIGLLALSDHVLLSVALMQVLILVETVLSPAFYTLISLVVPPRMRGLGLQTSAPWQVLGLVVASFAASYAASLGMHRGILVFVPLLLIGASILASAAPGVERDMRAVAAAEVADDAVRRARAAGAAPLVVCRDVEVAYAGAQVLFGVDLDVREGEIVALLGTNGAGKSTLLRAIAGLVEPSQGAILYDGRDVTHSPAHRTAGLGVAMVPGGRGVFPALTVADNLKIAGWTGGDGGDRRGGHADDDVLDVFPALRDRLGDVAANLSGGEQQMVALAQAFLRRPRLLLVDELSLGLAPAVVEQLLGAVRRMHDRGMTILLVEQSLNVAVTIADRAVFMEKGQIRFDGPTDELLARPDLVRSVFLGGAARARTGRAPLPVPGEPAAPVLDASGLVVAYGGRRALDGAHVTAVRGEVVGVIGPNGAGKTTLFDALSGMAEPAAGSVLLDGTDVTGLPPDARARLGLSRSFQNARLFPGLTVREVVTIAHEREAPRSVLAAAAWWPSLRRGEARLARQVDELIDLLGLPAYADKFVDELSTGTRRAVDVACLMALRPKVLLLDEPSSGLAQAEIEELGPLVTRLARELGCAVLLIEHDIPLVSSVSDRMVAMELGRVVAEGAPAAVLADPRVVESYLAASADVVHRSGSRLAAVANALAVARTEPEE